MNKIPKQTDFSECDLEPIHVPNKIQGHGALIAFTKEGTLLFTSMNIGDFLGSNTEMANTIEDLLPSDKVLEIRNLIKEAQQTQLFSISIEIEKDLFEGLFHINLDGVAILELIRKDAEEESTAIRGLLGEFYQNIENLNSDQELLQYTTRLVRDMTGFDRVMIYRFAPDGSGQVIAEMNSKVADSFLGLHFPASDIPKQARRLYVLNRIRSIRDTESEPIKLKKLNGDNQHTPKSLDLSFSVLRSVSPVHVQYLKNMGVVASMSVSIIIQGELWGLIACHHMSPLGMTTSTRDACEVIARLVSSELALRDGIKIRQTLIRREQLLNDLLDSATENGDFITQITSFSPSITDFFECDGACIVHGESIKSIGSSPEKKDIVKLVRWLKSQKSEFYFSTHELPVVYSRASSFEKKYSGVLAVPLSQENESYVLWFREEKIKKLTWAGNPAKSVIMDSSGVSRLQPRESFEAWKQELTNQSESWHDWDILTAKLLGNIIRNMIIRSEANEETCARMNGIERKRRAILNMMQDNQEQTSKLLESQKKYKRITKELQRSNEELSQFAYVASHDLKAPLRAVKNYSDWILEDIEDQKAVRELVDKIKNRANRMEMLLNGLLDYARVGSQKECVSHIETKRLIENVVEFVSPPENFIIEVNENIPDFEGHVAPLELVLRNLISNAVKHHDKQTGVITVSGDSDVDHLIFSVKDNGPGIPEGSQKEIFELFRTLTSADKKEHSTGLGLAMVKKVVETHGGKITVGSEEGKGATFTFSWPREPSSL